MHNMLILNTKFAKVSWGQTDAQGATGNASGPLNMCARFTASTIVRLSYLAGRCGCLSV